MSPHDFETRHITGALPGSVLALAQAAADEGVRNVGLLITAWQSGEERFDSQGAALFGAFRQYKLIALGGVTPEPALPGMAFRVRRFYVHPAHRRSGVARGLANAAMTHGLQYATVLTCNARASAAAGPFWEAMGFKPVDATGWTHLYQAA